jgi:hypothetical protein
VYSFYLFKGTFVAKRKQWNICRNKFYQVSRHGRENSGNWDDSDSCQCEHPGGCSLPDDEDVGILINAYNFLETATQLFEKFQKEASARPYDYAAFFYTLKEQWEKSKLH